MDYSTICSFLIRNTTTRTIFRFRDDWFPSVGTIKIKISSQVNIPLAMTLDIGTVYIPLLIGPDLFDQENVMVGNT